MLAHNKYSCSKYPHACICCSLNAYCKQTQNEIDQCLPRVCMFYVSAAFRLEAVPGRWNCVMESVILGSRELYLNVSTFYSLACFLPSVPPIMFLKTGSYSYSVLSILASNWQ